MVFLRMVDAWIILIMASLSSWVMFSDRLSRTVTWIFSLILAFGLRIGSAEAVFLTMIPLLASAFPITPAGAGVVEITLFTCLRVAGISTPIAGSLTVVNRLAKPGLEV